MIRLRVEIGNIMVFMPKIINILEVRAAWNWAVFVINT